MTDQASEAYDELCAAIVGLRVLPGAVLSESTFRKLLGWGPGRSSAAFRRAEAVGLLKVIPRIGLLVSPVDALSARQVFDARAALESYLGELAAARITPEEINSLKQLALKMRGIPAGGAEAEGFVWADREFHLAVARTAANDLLESSLQRVWLFNTRLWNLYFHQRGSGYQIDHSGIIAGLEAHDPMLVRGATLEHLAAAKSHLQTGLWGQPQDLMSGLGSDVPSNSLGARPRPGGKASLCRPGSVSPPALAKATPDP